MLSLKHGYVVYAIRAPCCFMFLFMHLYAQIRHKSFISLFCHFGPPVIFPRITQAYPLLQWMLMWHSAVVVNATRMDKLTFPNLVAIENRSVRFFSLLLFLFDYVIHHPLVCVCVYVCSKRYNAVVSVVLSCLWLRLHYARFSGHFFSCVYTIYAE